MIRVAIVGCGKQADAHATVLQQVDGCQIVGACDSEVLMARQLYERYKIASYYDNVYALLEGCAPDVIHLNTPPHTHMELGRICLEAGCHVFFEKPLGLRTDEVERLIAVAQRNRRLITVGHNNQFNDSAIRMRTLVRDGVLGGRPLHMESVWGYDLGDQRFAQSLLGDKTHWIRRLPGGLLHNIISHGIGKLAEFLEGQSLSVVARGFTSDFLRRIHESDIVDELRVIINDEQGNTAYFTFSTQIRPMIRQLRLYGAKGSLVVDDMHETVTVTCRTDYKSYLNHMVPPLLYARQHCREALGNIRRFGKRELNFDSGRRRLVESFYRSIATDGEVPIPYVEIVRTSRIMDKIFEQVVPKRDPALVCKSW
jgi:predicted dehydrogenase